MVGNGATDFNYDIWPSYAQVIWGLQMIPTSLKDAWFDDKCHKYFHDVMPNNLTKGSKCADHFDKMIALTSGAGLNWYDLYR